MTFMELLRLLLELLPLLVVVFACASGAAWLFFRSKFVPRSTCAECRSEIQNKVEVHEVDHAAALVRITAVEVAIKGLPTSSDMHQLNNAITALQGSVNTMNQRIEGAVSTLDAKVTGISDNMGLLMETHMKP